MGKARSFSGSDDDAVLQTQSDSENYSLGAQQNTQNLGSVHFSDNSGYGNFSQAGRDQRNASLEGALFRGNIGFNLQTCVLDVGTETIDLLEDGASNPLNVVSTDKIVTISSGTTADLTTILGVQRPGQRLLLYGIQGNTITIKHTAAATPNTILTPDGNDFPLSNTNAALLVYDITTAKWRVLSGGGSGGGGGLTDPIILNENDLGTIGFISQQIDWSTNNFYRCVINGNVAFSMQNLPAAGKWEQLILQITQDAVGGHIVTFLDTFANLVVPTVNTGGSSVTTIAFYAYNDGSNIILAFDVLSNFGATTGIEYGHFTKVANQAPPLTVGTPATFDSIISNSGLTIDAAGRISGLRAGHVYELECFMAITNGVLPTAEVTFQWYDVANATVIGSMGNALLIASAATDSGQPSARAIFTAAADSDTLEVHFTFNNDLVNTFMWGMGVAGTPQSYAIVKDVTGFFGGAGTVINFPSVLINDVVTITSPAASLNIDVAVAQHYVIELDKAITITFTNPPPDINTSEQVVLEFIQDGTGGHTVGYTDTISPSVPVISLTPGAREVVTGFIRRTAGGSYVYNLYTVGS